MLGTADQVDVWLMLETPGTWPARALEQGTLSPALRVWLERSVASLKAEKLRVRPQLIKQGGRQPGASGSQRRLLIGFAHRLYQVEVVDDAALLSLDLGNLIKQLRRGDTGQMRVIREPHYFVCTNGRRDLCCARFGLPVYRRLQELVGDRVWQVSHVGGHRFAPNVLTLPDGVLYGRVQLEQVAAYTQVVESGALAFDWLRGRSCYPAEVQAAEGMLAKPQLKLLHVEVSENATRVVFGGPQGRELISVARSAEPKMILASCDQAELKAVYPFLRRV